MSKKKTSLLITMGNFSFITYEGRPILNAWNKGGLVFLVYMHAPDGKVWAEPAYGGYGIFGGKDIFVLLAELNIDSSELEGKSEDDIRDMGIDLYYEGKDKIKVWPVRTQKKVWKGHFEFPLRDDPKQGDFCSTCQGSGMMMRYPPSGECMFLMDCIDCGDILNDCCKEEKCDCADREETVYYRDDKGWMVMVG